MVAVGEDYNSTRGSSYQIRYIKRRERDEKENNDGLCNDYNDAGNGVPGKGTGGTIY